MKMATRNPYPALIVLLLAGFFAFSTWAALKAVDSGPQVTDADYYSKGLRYTATLVEKRAAMVLGWTVSTRLDGQTLEFLLNDKEGQPVTSAEGTITLQLSSRASGMKFPLAEVEPGTYRLKLTERTTGNISARLEFERGGARLSRQLLLNL